MPIIRLRTEQPFMLLYAEQTSVDRPASAMDIVAHTDSMPLAPWELLAAAHDARVVKDKHGQHFSCTVSVDYAWTGFELFREASIALALVQKIGLSIMRANVCLAVPERIDLTTDPNHEDHWIGQLQFEIKRTRVFEDVSIHDVRQQVTA